MAEMSRYSALEFAFRAATDYLRDLDTRPVGARMSAAELRQKLGRAFPEHGVAADKVIRELVEDAGPGVLGSASGRFFAWVVGGSLPSALAADWLTSAWDQNGTLYATAPAASVVEEVAGNWLKDTLHLPPEATFAFTTGCQMAHLTCLAAARHALLARRGWNVEERGLSGAPHIRILYSTEHHGSVLRAVRFLGLGTESIERLDTNDAGQLDGSETQRRLEERPDAPAILVLQAGDINTGAFDNFAELIPVTRRYPNVWVHVDGAFGLWANATPTHQHLTSGVEFADSWATDGHKWLNVPFDSGYAFINSPEAHHAAMSIQAPYLTQGTGNRDALDWTPEWSRRCRGFATYAALRELGRQGIGEMIERCCGLTARMVTGLEEIQGVEILRRPVLNQALVRFPDRSGKDHDQHTEAVVNRVNETGEAFFSTSVWRGTRCMRISVCNWCTSEKDIDRALSAVSRALTGTAPRQT
jgi:glutamate/tyrosine decarboxylase-like PLP-dependent enzyme